MLERVETLLAQRRSEVAADRRYRRWIVEANIRCVAIHDDDGGSAESRRAEGNACKRQAGNEQRTQAR